MWKVTPAQEVEYALLHAALASPLSYISYHTFFPFCVPQEELFELQKFARNPTPCAPDLNVGTHSSFTSSSPLVPFKLTSNYLSCNHLV